MSGTYGFELAMLLGEEDDLLIQEFPVLHLATQFDDLDKDATGGCIVGSLDRGEYFIKEHDDERCSRYGPASPEQRASPGPEAACLAIEYTVHMDEYRQQKKIEKRETPGLHGQRWQNNGYLDKFVRLWQQGIDLRTVVLFHFLEFSV